jgi:hypothetical protein
VNGASYDRIVVSGTAALGGSLVLQQQGQGLTFGTAYSLVSASGGTTGAFGSVTIPGSAGIDITTTNGGGGIQLTPAAGALLPGPAAGTTVTTITTSPSTTTAITTPTASAPTSTTVSSAPGLGGGLAGNLVRTAAALDAARAAAATCSPSSGSMARRRSRSAMR